jgi:Ca2+-binding EF-hand superfamily protein
LKIVFFRLSKAIFDLLGEERKGANSPELKVDQIFSKMDVNGDGKLSKEEFINGCLQDDYLRRLLAPSAS